ncbi:MAG: hypothetical protein IKL31_11580, partial [Ruminococcus sp.]|nr:hypothetical protein [Ruminococcus sp.]
VKMQKSSELYLAMGSAKKLPKEQRLAMAKHIMKRLSLLQKSELKVAKSGHFNSLPTDEEYNKAMAELKGEKLPETEENIKTEGGEEIIEKASVEIKEHDNSEKAEKAEPDTDSYELRKVKRSRAKSKYLETIKETQPTAVKIVPEINIKE